MRMRMRMTEIPKERFTCKYCSYCVCSEDTIGGAYCYADIHDYIFDVNAGKIFYVLSKVSS